MRALLVLPRRPGTGFTGDRLRAEIHLAALAEAGYEAQVVSADPPGVLGTGSALVRALYRGDPLQSALFAGPWTQALSRAGSSFDLVVVLLPQRLPPAVLRLLPPAPVVLDFIDALGASARQASSADPALWRRLYWRLEAGRLGRAERDAAQRARVLFATTASDAGSLPAGTIAVPNGVAVGPPPPAGPRGPVVAFTGRLRYRPNEIAVRRLVKEIWPGVRGTVAGARLIVGGADAPPEILSWHGRDGVEVTSPVPDIPAFLRGALVAAAPLTLGSGTPNKLFEAFEAGCAVVATGEVAARAACGGASPPVRIAGSAGEFAAALADYLASPAAAAADGRRGRAWVEAHADRRSCVAALAGGYRRAREAAA